MTPRFLVRALLISFGVAVTAYLGASLLPKKYASNMSLYFPAGQNKASNALASLAGGGAVAEGDAGAIVSLGGAVSSPLVASGPASATGILLSRTCLTETVDKLDLARAWGASNELAAVERLRSAVSVSTDKNGFLLITCTEDNAELCQSIVNHLKQHLDRRASELTMSLASSNRALVEDQYKKADTEVETVRQKLLEALAAGGPNSIEESARSYLQVRTKVVEIKSEAEAAAASIRQQEQALSKYLAGAGKDVSALENAASTGPSASMSKLAEELQARRLEMAEIGRKFTNLSPEFQDANKRLRAVEEQANSELARQRSRIKDGTNLKLIEAKAQLSALNQSLEVYKRFQDEFDRQMRGLPRRNALIQESQSLFDLALQTRARLKSELDRAKLAELRDPSRYKVVDTPIVDPSPVSPRKGIIAAIFFLLASATQFLLLSMKSPRLPKESEGLVANDESRS
ncbi:MAG: hypothetical protein JNJ45_07890 [Chthonomonas sp.]|nr:hypothetical protein [Chthonomonas sp.]